MQSRFSMFMKTHEGMFARQNENLGTNLYSLLTQVSLPNKSKKKTLDILPNRQFSPSNLECKELNGGFRNFMYAITEV